MALLLTQDKPLYEGKSCNYTESLELVDDGFHYEIIEGVMSVVPAPLEKHQDILGYIYVELTNFLRQHPMGKVSLAPRDVKLAESLVYQPDLLFIAKERQTISKPQYVDGSPDFIIEILSGATLSRDTRIKFYDYEKYGVKEYWIVNPQDIKHSEFYSLEENHYTPFDPEKNTIYSKVIIGFSLDLVALEKYHNPFYRP